MRRLLILALSFAAFAAVAVLPAAADCTCRAQGRNFELGQAVCLATPGGLRVATCGMVLNNSSWEVTPTPCTVSQRLPQRPVIAHDPGKAKSVN